MGVILIEGGAITVVPPSVKAMVVHDQDQCSGRTCVIHAPTAHAMRSWPLHWRSDRAIFERICAHGVGHPDPDQQAFWREEATRDRDADFLDGVDLDLPDPDEHVSTQMTHGCDGCCVGMDGKA